MGSKKATKTKIRYCNTIEMMTKQWEKSGARKKGCPLERASEKGKPNGMECIAMSFIVSRISENEQVNE